MARGFESKDVEWQQQEMLERRAAAQKPVLAPEEVERQRKREGLELQRKRVLQQIEGATEARYRETLQRGLRFLDEQIAQL
jgi:hypothetical protein